MGRSMALVSREVRVAALLRRAAFKPGEELWSGELVEGQLGGAEAMRRCA